MNPEVKQKWLAALRSGDYKQGKGQLRLDDEYCCLGVLCDLASKEGISSWDDPHFGEYLPYIVCDWAGLDGLDRKNPTFYGLLSCAYKNDSGSDFKLIADLIEEYL